MGSFAPHSEHLPSSKTSLYTCASSRKLELPLVLKDENRMNTEPRDSYMNGFVSHAEIHQLAYKTDLTSLRALSTYRLIQSLKIFTLFEECTKDIVRLARFVFKESEYISHL